MEEALRAALLAASAVTAITGPKIDWGLSPQGASRPAIRLSLVSRVRYSSYAGRSRIANTRVQVDCFADSYGAAKQLSRAVVSLTDTLWPQPFMGVQVAAERDEQEDAEPSPIFTTSLDLMVWHAEP